MKNIFIDETLEQDIIDKAISNENFINEKLFKKPNNSKIIIRNKLAYETLAENLLDMYLSSNAWGVAFDKDSKSLYIINLLCPNNIPNFSLVGVSSYDEFVKLVLGAGKKILIEENLDRFIPDEEYNELLAKAQEVANKYKG